MIAFSTLHSSQRLCICLYSLGVMGFALFFFKALIYVYSCECAPEYLYGKHMHAWSSERPGVGMSELQKLELHIMLSFPVNPGT